MGRRKMITRTRHWALLAAWVLLSSCAVSPTGRTQFIIISPDAAIIESEAATWIPSGSWTTRTSWSATR